MDKDVLQELLGRGLSLQKIADRFGMHPSTVGYWVKKHGLSAVNGSRHAARGGISRDRLEALVAEGHSVASMADALELSTTTIRHWLRKYGIETSWVARVRHTRASRARGDLRIQRECATHGLTRFSLDQDRVYRCLRCRSEAVSRRRRLVRETLVREAGGHCATCGYEGYVGALQFHHLDPAAKRFALSSRGITRSIESLRAEASKCVLLCANCHAEVEAGVRILSVELLWSLKSAGREVDYPD